MELSGCCVNQPMFCLKMPLGYQTWLAGKYHGLYIHDYMMDCNVYNHLHLYIVIIYIYIHTVNCIYTNVELLIHGDIDFEWILYYVSHLILSHHNYIIVIRDTSSHVWNIYVHLGHLRVQCS